MAPGKPSLQHHAYSNSNYVAIISPSLATADTFRFYGTVDARTLSISMSMFTVATDLSVNVRIV
jgi:hypothetical protein